MHAQAGKITPYTYYAMGDPARTVTAAPLSANPSIALMGGGYDVGEAFRWMIARAGVTPATGGRFVVLRATGSDGYNPYIFSRLGTTDATTGRSYENVGGQDLGLSSVETLVVPTREAASDPFVTQAVSRASALWIAGGDQAAYYNAWKGTPLQSALQAALARGVPVGGTSAGAMVLGQYGFAALKGSVTSSQALADPFNRYMTLDGLNTTPGSFLTLAPLRKTLADTHLNTRDRLGRLAAFVARIGRGCPGGAEAWNDAWGIGIDEETALLVSQDDSGSVTVRMAVNPYNAANFSAGAYAKANSAYFLRMSAIASRCAAGVPLLVQSGGVMVHRLSDPAPVAAQGTPPYASYLTGNTFSLSLWKSGAMTGLGNAVAGPFYYGTDTGALRQGPTPY